MVGVLLLCLWDVGMCVCGDVGMWDVGCGMWGKGGGGVENEGEGEGEGKGEGR